MRRLYLTDLIKVITESNVTKSKKVRQTQQISILKKYLKLIKKKFHKPNKLNNVVLCYEHVICILIS